MSKQNKILELANQIISLISSHNTDTSAHTNLFNNKEDKSNKNTNLNSQSTHTQYPTSKTVYDALSGCVKTSDSRLSDARTPKSHTHTKAEISDFPTSMTPTSHAHGNITNAGAIGSTANLPVITTTSGKLTTGSFGTGANTFCQGNDPRLSDARTPTSHTHSYLPLSGGTMSGPIQYPQLRSSATVDNIPYAGAFNWNTNILTTLKERKSLLGTVPDGSQWWSVISVRHRNGTTDGDAWGMHIRTPLTTNTSEANANLYWQRDLNGVATNERILIDNENMVKNDVVNNVLSRATNNQSTVGWFKILTIKIQGGYSDSNIKFSINRRSQPTTNIELYFQYYKKDTTSSDFYYKLNKCYYDGQPHDTRIKQTVDNVGTGTFDVYIYAEGWADTSITPVITNNDRLNKNNLIITPVNTFVTSLPSGCIQAVKNPNYVADNDSRLSDARTPKSHTHTKSEISDFPTSMTPTSHVHGNITNAGTIGSTANLPIITTTSGKLTTGSFGTAANTFCQGNDSRLSNARTPTAHASTATTYGASSASNYGHSMASSTSPKAPGTANVGSETAKFARGDHVHPLQSSTTTTLSLVNTSAMSGTVKCTESNGWGVVYFEGLKCTNTTTEYTPFATLPHTSKARIYTNFNLDATGTNAILFRVNNNQLQGRVMTANQRMYGSIVYPIA